jgi:hypothetical protein
LDFSNYKEILSRMTRQIRGIGDPLVAIFTRCYLVRIGTSLIKEREYIKDNFLDFLFTYHYVIKTLIRQILQDVDKLLLNFLLDIQHKNSF